MKKRTRRLQLNRETLRRLDDELAWIRGGTTGTCAGSGCEGCATLHGSGCMSKQGCPVYEVPDTIWAE